MPKKKRPGPKPRPRPVPRALTERREAFCREFLVDYNGTKAAIRAGYSQKGAAQTAWLLLRNAKVHAELSRLGSRVKKKAELSAVALLETMTNVALGDIRELFEPGREVYGGGAVRSVVKDIRALTKDEQDLVAGYKSADGVVDLKIENRMRAREMLMKHLGLLKEHVRLETASELTMEEEETISKMSNEELREFRVANETVERLLHPEELA